MLYNLETIIKHLRSNNNQKPYYDSTEIIDNLTAEAKNQLQKQAKMAADEILSVFSLSDGPLQIGSLMNRLNFELYTNKFDDDTISGILALNLKNEQDNTAYPDKIIMVNQNDNVGHQRFTIAHELAHYIFDSSDDNEYYEAYYRTDIQREKEVREYRANQFADNLLMPANTFKKRYQYLTTKANNLDFIIQILCDDFGVSATAIKKRLLELNLKDKKVVD